MAHVPPAAGKAEAVSITPHTAPHFSGLLGSGKYSDLTLRRGSRSWKVHKGVLCLQSDFFAKACDGDFREAHTDTIDLSEDHEYTVAAMVHFMYHGKYDADHVLPSAKSEGGCEMLLHVRVVGVAQKYFIEPLQKFAGGLAAELMKAWDGKSSIFAESMLAIYTCTEDVAFGTMLRERAVEVAMDNALLLFGEGFMEDWARAMSYCNDTLSTANINLEVMNDVLNDDNVKLDDRHKKLKDAFDQLKAAAKEVEQTSLKVSKDYSDLINQYDDLYSKTKDLVSIPDRPTENDSYVPSGPAPDCYMCPNCEVLFFKAMRSYSNYHQNCFENGWCGKLGKGGVQMSYGEWQAHLVRKA